MLDKFSIRICPFCGSNQTVPRSGVHFEGERRCWGCNRSWDVQEEFEKWSAKKQEEEEYFKSMTTDRD